MSVFFTFSVILYSFSKHNLLFDYTAKIFVNDLCQSDLVIKEEIAEDRRIVVQRIIKEQHHHFQNLIIGSSRIMQLGKFIGMNNSLNLGVSAANLNDIQAVLKLTKRYHIQYDTLIFDLNPWTVNQSIESRDLQFSTIHNFGEALKDVFTFNYQPNDLFYLLQKKQIKYYKANTFEIKNPNNFVRFTDGSIKQKTLGPIMKSGRVDFFCHDLYLLKNFYKIDSIMLNTFVNIIKNECRNHQVVVFLSPFHPKLFQTRRSDIRVQNLQKLETLFFAKAPKKIQIIGGFDPKKFNLTDTNFVDGFHINEKTIANFFKIRKNF